MSISDKLQLALQALSQIGHDPLLPQLSQGAGLSEPDLMVELQWTITAKFAVGRDALC